MDNVFVVVTHWN